MANSKNLIPNSQRTPEQLKAMGAKGGKASAEKAKKLKNARQEARFVLGLIPEIGKAAQKELKKVGYGVEAEGNPNVMQLMFLSLASQGINGDQGAFRTIMDYAQYPDLKATLEREKLRAAKEGRVKIDLTASNAEYEAAMAEIRAAMAGELPPQPSPSREGAPTGADEVAPPAGDGDEP